jgi:hypothetical protein
MDEAVIAAAGPAHVDFAEELRAQGLQRGMAIADGRGGALWLDLASPGISRLAEALLRLMSGQVPPGATVLKVTVGAEVYLASWREGGDGEETLQLAKLFDPGERVALSRITAETVASLLALAARQAAVS